MILYSRSIKSVCRCDQLINGLKPDSVVSNLIYGKERLTEYTDEELQPHALPEEQHVTRQSKIPHLVFIFLQN